MSNQQIPSVLVVCMGNICRSPTGEAVLKARAKALGIDVDIDSAGTINYHQGKGPDSRSVSAGEKRGYSFSGIKSRQITEQDFVKFDYVLAADRANMADMLDICPREHAHKISLFLSHSDSDYQEIPDPYYGGSKGFELVLDLIEEASDQFLQKISA